MKLLVSGSTNRLSATPKLRQHLGDFTTPARRQRIGRTDVWAADNGCFGDFDRAKFMAMLDEIQCAEIQPKFVTVPDVVCDSRATAERWIEWAAEFHKRNLPRAYVLQNGIEEHPPEYAIPWNNLRAIFIGGDNAFKHSAWVRRCVAIARQAGRWVHMGRVNSIKRLEYAKRIGCHSVDGSGMSRFENRVLLPMAQSLEVEQLQLF